MAGRVWINPRAEAVPLARGVVARLPEDLAPEAWNFEVELKALGFRFEPFGDGAVRISAAPETVTVFPSREGARRARPPPGVPREARLR